MIMILMRMGKERDDVHILHSFTYFGCSDMILYYSGLVAKFDKVYTYMVMSMCLP